MRALQWWATSTEWIKANKDEIENHARRSTTTLQRAVWLVMPFVFDCQPSRQ
tara:strand:+ start:9702 stop:9857 length:156 start_codon:yes stop_codon:yes gene_type:complete